ncbi:M18 family aminopeptidase [Lachnospiraceae bacterium]|uniref:M18 family aminopeptidase n=1 Tax=Extibacter sp. GGCC_0201 TaxID=2731209 RepID=UPI001AA19BC3|nr:M18 family aminopeptidase [Extibacter sp. GGCC_0201]MBO1722590.1 M18 family aminopeptidase [Extibacter sp. GGCC_0201]BDF35028.1 M18 family aminopeptidase [Lachnospiraceae bacterium]BDF39029.1 M18 family aminopeptidase [Lachnospiraceae bacterium]
MDMQITEELFTFIEKSPSPYHAVRTAAEMLTAMGYKRLEEHQAWELDRGGRYYVTRNLSSVIAFRIPEEIRGGFHIVASHSDSPSFKIKENPEIASEQKYIRLNVEKYGGMLMSAWLDRPLSAAGRLLVRNGDGVTTRLVNVDRDLLLIPNLAIHMNREVNDGYKYNPQTDLLPLYGDFSSRDSFMQLIAETAGVQAADILGSDLFLYNRMPGTVWGADNAFISCGRLDDLQCAFGSLKGFTASKESPSVPVFCMLDNEEVGSTSKQGAASTFIRDTLRRICITLGNSEETYHTMMASSFMVSADNAHAVHPNQPGKTDETNRPYMNEGIVIKYSANQKYTTDAVSAAIFKSVCQKAKVPYQTFLNRSDMTGGSTLGNIANTQTAMNTVDIGLAQLAMHSPYETAGVRDTGYLLRASRTFYESLIQCKEDGSYRID